MAAKKKTAEEKAQLEIRTKRFEARQKLHELYGTESGRKGERATSRGTQ